MIKNIIKAGIRFTFNANTAMARSKTYHRVLEAAMAPLYKQIGISEAGVRALNEINNVGLKMAIEQWERYRDNLCECVDDESVLGAVLVTALYVKDTISLTRTTADGAERVKMQEIIDQVLNNLGITKEAAEKQEVALGDIMFIDHPDFGAVVGKSAKGVIDDAN